MNFKTIDKFAKRPSTVIALDVPLHCTTRAEYRKQTSSSEGLEFYDISAYEILDSFKTLHRNDLSETLFQNC